MLSFLKCLLFNSNFIFSDSFLFIIVNFNEEYFKNNFIFYLRLRKLELNKRHFKNDNIKIK